MNNNAANEIILPARDVTLTYPEKISILCRPLAKFHITFVCYLRVYPDGSAVDICNAPEMQEYFYYKTEWYKSFAPLSLNANMDLGFVLDKSFIDLAWINLQKNLFDIDYVIYLVKSNPYYMEYWQFGTKSDNHGILNFYIQHADLLRAYTQYFLYQGQTLISIADKNRYKPLALNSAHALKINNYSQTFINNLIAQFNGSDLQGYGLTTKEVECLKLCARGASAKEIGRELAISYRTAEKHINNIKLKTGLRKIAHVVSKLQKDGLI